MFFPFLQCDSDEREDVGSTGHHAISGHGAEDNRVTAVEQAAVPRHDVTGIFGGKPAFDVGFGQIADDSRIPHDNARYDGPNVAETAVGNEHDDEHPEDDAREHAAGDALPGLLGRDVGRELVPAES